MPMPSRNKGGPMEPHDPEQKATKHGPWNAADPAEHGCAECFDPRQEAQIEIDLLVDQAVEHATDAGHSSAQDEREQDHCVGVDPHHRGDIAIFRDRPHGQPHLGPVHDKVEK